MASERIGAVSAELIGCANRVAEEEEGEETSLRQLEDLHETLETTELLRRDWASQVNMYFYLQSIMEYIRENSCVQVF